MKKIAVVLSGCGFKDGSEITESIGTLISLNENGAVYQCFAPDLDVTTVNHMTSEKKGTRNILAESARICRGNITELSQLKEQDFDGVVFPGGFGAATHFCDWAQKGANCEVLPEIKSIIEAFHQASKPIGAICISPVIIAKVLGKNEVSVTIGEDKETIMEVEKTGAQHEECKVDDYITDRENKVISTPAYMYDDAPSNMVFKGITGLIKELVEMA